MDACLESPKYLFRLSEFDVCRCEEQSLTVVRTACLGRVTLGRIPEVPSLLARLILLLPLVQVQRSVQGNLLYHATPVYGKAAPETSAGVSYVRGGELRRRVGEQRLGAGGNQVLKRFWTNSCRPNSSNRTDILFNYAFGA